MTGISSILRPNYRRARALALEIEAIQNLIEQETDESALEEFEAELKYLHSELFKTGVTSEYEL